MKIRYLKPAVLGETLDDDAAHTPALMQPAKPMRRSARTVPSAPSHAARRPAKAPAQHASK